MKTLTLLTALLAPQLAFSAPSLETLTRIIATQQASIKSLKNDVKNYVQISGDRLAYYALDGKDGLEKRANVIQTSNRFQQAGQATAFSEGSCLLDNRGLEHNKRLNSGGSVSIVGWIKPQKYESGIVIAKHYTHNKRSWNVNMVQGNLAFGIIATDNSDVMLETPFPKDGKWHHIAAIYNKGLGQMKIYIDGREAGSKNVGTRTIMDTNLPITIGCYLLSDDATVIRDHFVGDIDDLAVFNRPLTSDQVGLLMSFDL